MSKKKANVRRTDAAEFGPMVNAKMEPVVRSWQRVLITFSITALCIAYRMYPYFTRDNPRDMNIGIWNKTIGTAGIVKIVECETKAKDQEFPGCEPAKCGRYAVDKLVSESEAQALINMAEKGMALGGGAGGATIMDLHTWALSKGSQFADLRKLAKNSGIKELFTYEDLKLYRTIKNRIQTTLEEKWKLKPGLLHLTKPTFFSRITAKPATNIHDEYWHSHIDKEQYERFHYTTLLYLNTHQRDYKGGRLIFDTRPLNHTMEPRSGRVLMFTSGKENPHHVEKVMSGTRYAITIPFTCDKNFAISDPIFQ